MIYLIVFLYWMVGTCYSIVFTRKGSRSEPFTLLHLLACAIVFSWFGPFHLILEILELICWKLDKIVIFKGEK